MRFKNDFAAICAAALCLSPSLVPAQAGNTDLVRAQASDRVVACTLSGQPAWQSPGVLPGASWGIAVDGQRNVWVSNYSPGQNTVSKFGPTGSHLGTFAAGPVPAANESSVGPIAIDAQGFVYVGDPRDLVPGTVTKLDPQGGMVTTFPVGGSSVRALAIDPNGDLWVLYYWGLGGHLEKRTNSGTLLFALAVPGANANGLYLDEWGRVLLTHYPNPTNISLYDLAGGVLGLLSSNNGQNHFRAVGVAPDGKVWANGAVTIEVFSPGGASLATLYGGIGWVSAFSFDGAGNTWANFYQNYTPAVPGGVRLRKYSASTTSFVTEFFAGTNTPNGPSFNIGDMTGMVRARTVDPYGDLDGDGHANLVEVVAGQSPLDPLSVPATITPLNTALIGTTYQIAIMAFGDAGLPYFNPWSHNPAPFDLASITPSDYRRFPISPFDAVIPGALDPLWTLSTGLSPFTPLLFPDTSGSLDFLGSATVRVNIPNLPSIAGAQLFTAFATLDNSKPSGIRTISARSGTTIQ